MIIKKNFEKYISAEYMIPAVIIAVGILVRLVWIGKYPCGLNQDEASAGYDAYAVLKYGIDRNGISFPVHFISWGSGQNAAYSWICMPFIALMGLSEVSVRLPMALIGCISTAVFYLFMRKVYGGDRRYAISGALMFALCPWHIMKSRWGLESNIFPDLVLWSAYLTVLYENNNKTAYLYAAFALLGFSMYSYGTAYCFVPIFAVLMSVYMLKKGKANVKQLLSAFLILAVIALPIILFVIINTFDMPQIHIGAVTIPRLYQNRHTEVASVFSKDFLRESISNFWQSVKILILQEDGLEWNSIRFFGLTYVITLPLALFGIYKAWARGRSGEYHEYIMNFWFAAAVILMFVVEPNINRLNIVVIPWVYYTAVGTAELWRIKDKIAIGVTVGVGAMFIIFTAHYFTAYQNNIAYDFFYGLGDAICAAEEEDTEKIYITDRVNQPYIFALFYSQASPEEYLSTVRFASRHTAFEQISSFGKYEFGIPKTTADEKAAYIYSVGERFGGSYESRVFGKYYLSISE